MFENRLHSMSLAKNPAQREMRRDNGKPRKKMPSQGVPTMGAPPAPDQGIMGLADASLEERIARMRQNAPGVGPMMPQEVGVGPSPLVGTPDVLLRAYAALLAARSGGMRR